jgi:hypothetical protein
MAPLTPVNALDLIWDVHNSIKLEQVRGGWRLRWPRDIEEQQVRRVGHRARGGWLISDLGLAPLACALWQLTDGFPAEREKLAYALAHRNVNLEQLRAAGWNPDSLR